MPARAVTASVALLVIVACGTRGFVRPGADHAAFYKDLKECTAEATPAWRACEGIACAQQDEQIRSMRNHCMLARGWQLSRSSDAFRP
jgi:hypothetical protein